MQAVSLRSYFIPAEPHHAEDSMHLPMDERLVTVQDVNINGILLSRSAELAKVQILVKKKKKDIPVTLSVSDLSLISTLFGGMH